MKKKSFKFKINLTLLFFGLLSIFSGLLLQAKYHLGHTGSIETNNYVLGLDYFSWSVIHKVSIVVLSIAIIFHIYLHWSWYCTVVKKKLYAKNKQVLTLTVIFIMVAVTGFIPWIINLLDGMQSARKAFIEIHDKLALILTVYLILHIVKRMRWYLIAK